MLGVTTIAMLASQRAASSANTSTSTWKDGASNAKRTSFLLGHSLFVLVKGGDGNNQPPGDLVCDDLDELRSAIAYDDPLRLAD